MKMRMFTAPTMEEAIALMHADLGPEAVLLSSREEGGVVEIRGAVERSFGHKFSAPRFSELRPMLSDASRDELAELLRWHGTPDGFIHLVSDAGSRLGAGLETVGSLAAGLEGVLSFAPIQTNPAKSLLLVGPPGSGKTTATAKLALHCQDHDSLLEPISADFDSSGQRARLAAMLLKPTLRAALSPEQLVALVREANNEGRRLVIDGPPFNPFDAEDMGRLRALIFMLNVEPVLVMSAEGHAMDLEDGARAFAEAGTRRTILTKIDLVRRRGGVLGAISSARLSIAQLGLTPNARCGLLPASAASIARLLLAGSQEVGEMRKGAA